MEGPLDFPPWVDLPDPITELILEHLPLLDYIRFAAVCQKWRSIQREHRIRHSPHPPPMGSHPRPWLIRHILCLCTGFDCYSPLEKKLHRIRFPTTPNLPPSTICLASARGWLLMLEDDTYFLDPLDDKPTLPISIRPFLFNPLTLAVIPLPMLSIIPGNKSFGAVSSPPVEPDCTILLISGGSVFLCRLNDPGDGWTMGLEIKESIVSIVYCGGKFYCMSRKGVLFVIDRACPTPTRLCLTIDASALDLRDGDMCQLVEFGGELLLVVGLKDRHFRLKGFEVFTADLSENKWAKKMDMLADHVLFLDERCSLSLLASDVGCKKNCIYYTHTHGPYILSAFDLDARDWIHRENVMYDNFTRPFESEASRREGFKSMCIFTKDCGRLVGDAYLINKLKMNA